MCPLLCYARAIPSCFRVVAKDLALARDAPCPPLGQEQTRNNKTKRSSAPPINPSTLSQSITATNKHQAFQTLAFRLCDFSVPEKAQKERNKYQSCNLNQTEGDKMLEQLS